MKRPAPPPPPPYNSDPNVQVSEISRSHAVALIALMVVSVCFFVYTISCASAPTVPAGRASIVATDVHNTIAAVDDLERALSASGQITSEQHARLGPAIVTLLKSGKAFDAALRAAVVAPAQANYQEALKAVTDALAEIAAVLPDGAVKARLLAALALAQGAIAGAAVPLFGGAQ